MASCESMCPVAEINFRSRNHLIDQLEATASTSSGPRSKYVADPTKMVKEYSRSAADTHKYNKPELLRPFPVLQHTIDYLLDLYSPFRDRRSAITSKQFASIFSFVSDRLRSIRQDMIMQNLRGDFTVILIEKMLPFYIETDGACKMAKCQSYDPILHDFQLEECFGRWFEEVSNSTDIIPNTLISACFFFRQLHRKSSILHDLYLFRRKLPHESFNLIQSIISSFYSSNYRRFFDIFQQLDPLLKHSLSDCVSILRQSAMKNISVAFKTPVARLPSQLLSDWLGFPANLEFFDDFLRLYSVIPDEQGNILISALRPPVEISYQDFSSRQYE